MYGYMPVYVISCLDGIAGPSPFHAWNGDIGGLNQTFIKTGYFWQSEFINCKREEL